MEEATIIQILVSGPTQCGKSSVRASIKDMLEQYGYTVAIPDREERNNPSERIGTAAPHEIPELDKTVFILTEVNK